jgi:hypothetical protein
MASDMNVELTADFFKDKTYTEEDVNRVAQSIPVLTAIAMSMPLDLLNDMCKEFETSHSRIQAIGFATMSAVDYQRKVEQVRYNLESTRVLRDFVKKLNDVMQREEESRVHHKLASDNLSRLNKAMGVE